MTERLAISLLDLDRLAPTIYTNMIVPNVIKKSIQVGPKVEEVAVEFCCPLLNAAVICDNLRSDDRKAGDYPTRIYVNYGDRWVKIGDNDVLTLVSSFLYGNGTGPHNSVRLNPAVFKVPPAPPIPLPTRPMKVGRKV